LSSDELKTQKEPLVASASREAAVADWVKTKVLIEQGERFKMTDARRDQVTIVVATLNEEQAIGPLIDEIRAAGYNKILVVDGYSKDMTVEIARAKGALVVGQIGKGKSGAVLSARDIVDTAFFLLMDGDYSYDPKDIDRFVAHAEGYDHIIGFRPKASPHMSKLHRLGNWVLSEEFNILMGANIPDVACGMYLMRTQKVKELVFHRHGFEVDQEIAAQMLVDGRVAFVPINYRSRIGEVKAPTWRQGFRALFAILGFARRYNPVVLFGLLAALALVPAVIFLSYAVYLYFSERIFQSNYLLTSLMLFVVGGQGLTVATIGYMLRRMERKIAGRGK
jgi:dolichol-phosphate mannosyltransferase